MFHPYRPVVYAANQTMIFRLIILSGDRRGEQITLTQDPMIIGSAKTCEIYLNDPEIALSHAEITHNADGLYIRDLGSMNRLLINHREVHEARPKHGDIIEVGHTRLLVQAYVQAEVQNQVDEEDEDEKSSRRRAWMVGGGLILLLTFMIIFIPRCERHFIAPRTTPSITPTPSKFPLPPARTNIFLRTPAPPPQTAPLPPQPVVVTPLPPKIEPAPVPTNTQAEMAPSKPEPPPNKEVAAPAQEQAVMPPPKPKKNPAIDLIAASEKELQEATLVLMGRNAASLTNTLPLAVSNAVPKMLVSKTNEPPMRPLSGMIKITGTEIIKFPETEQFKEMRLLTIQLTASEIQKKLDPEAVRVEVIFMNQDKSTGQIIPTSAQGQPTLLAVQGKWLGTEQKTVMASYVATAPPPPTDRATHYYGFSLRVFYYGTLQDELSQPRVLIPEIGGTNSAKAKSPTIP